MGQRNYIRLRARDLPIHVFAACCYTDTVDTIKASLHESPLAIENLLERWLEGLVERVGLRKELSFRLQPLGRWQILSWWKLWLSEGSKSGSFG